MIGKGKSISHGTAALEYDLAKVNTVHDAIIYYTIVKEILGEEWLNNRLFRLGTSRLANLLLSDIKGEEIKFF